MRLKSIKLAGFKSFVDPTTAEFPKNLSAVVGPNGCGKSNIIDAVRWVMGESSAKNLRGESMTDVIFNGSSARKPVGQASIELIFDNSDGSLVGEYANFSEISIKRRVTRESQNTYFLNGTKCRRRDITDIFLGTGLGPRSYAIIEQGMISKLIEAKPEELRVFIEEAAGISKYKERRRDTENRMRRTNENLERLTDIREELDRQLQHLERQAAAAERYKTLKKDERLFRAQLIGLRWQKWDGQLKAKTEDITKAEVNVESCVMRQTSLDTEIERHIGQHGELNEGFNRIQERYYSLGSDIARREQTISHQAERTQQLNADIELTAKTLEEGERHLQADMAQSESWAEELAMLEPEIELLQEGESDASERLLEAEDAMQRWQSDWDTFNHGAMDAKQQAQVQQSKIANYESNLLRTNERITRLQQEQSQMDAPVDDEVDILAEQVAEAQLEQETLQETLEQTHTDIEQQRQQLQEHNTQLDQARGKLQQLQGRYASLEALQQAAMSEQGEAVNNWLEAQGLSNASRLSNEISAHSGWELAVETLLGRRLQAISSNRLDALSSALNVLEQGYVELIDTQPDVKSLSSALLNNSLKPLSVHIDASDGVKSLFSGVFAADDIAQAMSNRTALSAEQSIITCDGIWVGPNWLKVSRVEDANAGLLARQQEVEMLAEQIDELEQQVEELTEQRQVKQDTLTRLERKREQEQQQSREGERQYGELNARLSAQKVKVEQARVRQERLQTDITELNEQQAIEKEQLSEARLLLETALASMEQDNGTKEQLQLRREQLREQLDTTRQQSRIEKDKTHQMAMRVQSLKAQMASVTNTIERSKQQVEQLKMRRQTLQASLAELQHPADDLQLELEALLEKRLGVEDELNRARDALAEADQSLKDAEKARNEALQKTQDARSVLEKLRIDRQALEVRRNGLLEKLDETEYQLEEVLEGLPTGATEQQWEQTISSLSGKIQRLGAINLAAIDEYKIQSERKTYLDAQNSDLLDALGMLENAIRKIDRETRVKFKETFDFVNDGLQTLFPKVFGGGRAYLELTGDDLLDTGIAIMAQPPGKRNSTIHLLSGGEKALTAIALVFSIFKLNPAPFCMLDEVDAPLDDANVGRYARMVKEMSEQVQFIYITHNKIAMEMAENLLGVTMHEAGVSRLVTVNVEEAAELAEVV